MQETQSPGDSDYDDHEPGDVNGNIDPAYARKQKQQARNLKRRDAGSASRGQGPRQPRATQAAVPGDGASPQTLLSAPNQAPLGGDHHDRSDGFDARSDVAVADRGADGADGSSEGELTRHVQPRARGPRRNRRGGRGRDREGGPRSVPRVLGSEPVEGQIAAVGDVFATPSERPADGTDDQVESRGSPNPGAFGDPNRPMDRSARRNRSRRDKRSQSRERNVPRAPQLDAEGNPLLLPEGGVTSGVNEHGERDGQRLHKVLAQQGLGSRRDMEALIEAGEVEVNGVKAHVGQVVNEKDRVHVKRRKVSVKLGDDKPRILIYHKQAGEIVSRDDPEQRDTVFDRLPKPDHGKWIAVGRLDYNSEGLLLFTTYGELANRFMHPRYEILREYSVRVLGELTPEQEDQLMDGIELEDGPARVLSLDRIDRDSDAANHWYRLTLNEGRNREVRRMFEHLGLTVSRLIRTSYGCVQMPSWLKRGQFKQLDEAETFNVLESVGLRSKKKLEKAARFGGRNKLPQQPLGPMRSATEHEAIWTGAPAVVGGTAGRGGRNQRGRGGQPRLSAATSQQFPGFGGASEMLPAGRKQRTPGNKIKGGNAQGRQGRQGRDGRRGGVAADVNGNVAPGYSPNAGKRRQGGNNSQRKRRGRGGQRSGNAAATVVADNGGTPMPDFE
ncbi:MAG: rRNA pseudouridine synthase [Burkholderiales bacterium]|nr:rRNA pseudouridine synthase [Burkholderiales bacterium]